MRKALAQQLQHVPEERHGAVLSRQTNRRDQLRLLQQHPQQPFLRHGGADVVIADAAHERLLLPRGREVNFPLLFLLDGAPLFVRLRDLELHCVRGNARSLCRARAVNFALHGARECGDELRGFLQKLDALLVVGQVILALQALELIFRLIFRLVQQEAEPVGPVFFQKFVRVLRALHPQDFDPQAHLLQHRDGAARGVLPASSPS